MNWQFSSHCSSLRQGCRKIKWPLRGLTLTLLFKKSIGEMVKPEFVFRNKWPEFHMCYDILCFLKVLSFSFLLLSLLLFTIHMALASHQWAWQIPHHSLLDCRLNQHGATAIAITQSILRFKNSACVLLLLLCCLCFSQKPLIRESSSCWSCC